MGVDRIWFLGRPGLGRGFVTCGPSVGLAGTPSIIRLRAASSLWPTASMPTQPHQAEPSQASDRAPATPHRQREHFRRYQRSSCPRRIAGTGCPEARQRSRGSEPTSPLPTSMAITDDVPHKPVINDFRHVSDHLAGVISKHLGYEVI